MKARYIPGMDMYDRMELKDVDGEAGRSVIEWMYILKGASKNEIKNVDKGKSLS